MHYGKFSDFFINIVSKIPYSHLLIRVFNDIVRHGRYLDRPKYDEKYLRRTKVDIKI